MRFAVLIRIVLVLAFVPANGVSPLGWTQQDKPQSVRKVLHREDPQYPFQARTLNLAGTVRLRVSVASSGAVQSVDVLGGHPMLVQAALRAVPKWKWEPMPHQTSESVEIKFEPN